MSAVKPEPVAGGESVKIGRHSYPIKQVGAVITGQDRRDFSSAEVVRALRKLGFTVTTPAPAEAEPLLPGLTSLGETGRSDPFGN